MLREYRRGNGRGGAVEAAGPQGLQDAEADQHFQGRG